MRNKYSFFTAFIAIALSACASQRPIPANAAGNGGNAVRWTGAVQDSPSSHNKDHDHELNFVRQGDKKEFEIVDSPDLVMLHHLTEKNYLLEIEGELTPKFLFWGGNLVVKNFKVLEESGAVPHGEQLDEPLPARRLEKGRIGL